MVNALRARSTNAAWSYEFLEQHSSVASVGRQVSITTRIPERELVIAMKLHSGRFVDARDVVAASANADFERVAEHLHRGDPDALVDQLEHVVAQLQADTFSDAFKGEFQESELPTQTIDRVSDFLLDQIENLSD